MLATIVCTHVVSLFLLFVSSWLFEQRNSEQVSERAMIDDGYSMAFAI